MNEPSTSQIVARDLTLAYQGEHPKMLEFERRARIHAWWYPTALQATRILRHLNAQAAAQPPAPTRQALDRMHREHAHRNRLRHLEPGPSG